METDASFIVFTSLPTHARTIDRRPLAIGQRFSLLILSEVRIVWETLADALAQELRFANITGVSSLAESWVQVNVVDPEIVLIDATMGGGLAAALWLHQRDPAIRLISFNMDETVQSSIAWIEAGIVAYIGRSVALKAIVELVGTLMNGEPGTDAPAVAKVADGLPTIRDRLIEGAVAAALTPREEEVVRLIVSGESNKEIAGLLKISLPTVKSHVHNLLAKLGLERRGKLALRYQSRPLVTKTVDTSTTVGPARLTKSLADSSSL